MTYVYGVFLAISIVILLYIIAINYDAVDIRLWSVFVLIPIILWAYWMKTRVTTPDAAAVCFGVIYLDSTVLLTIVVFAMLHYLRKPYGSGVKVFAFGLAFAHLAMVWLCFGTPLYYGSIRVTHTRFGNVTKMTSGPLKAIHWVYLVCIFLILCWLLIYAFTHKGTFSRRSLYLFTFLLGAGLFIYVLEIVRDVDFSALPLLYLLADLSMASIYSHAQMHDITSMISIEKENQSVKGYAAFSRNREFVSCTDLMLRYFPNLKDQIIDSVLSPDSFEASIFYDMIDEFESRRYLSGEGPEDMQDGSGISRRFSSGDMICSCEMSPFSMRKNHKISGYLFVARDVTREEADRRLIEDYAHNMQIAVEQKTANILGIQERIVLGLANMVENRDNNTGGHVKRTSEIIGYIVESVQKKSRYTISEELANDIVRAAPMHDLGKITIENAILLKPGKLTDEEYAIMKTHSVKSGEFVELILRDVEEPHFVNVAFNVARFHHERWDGRGYPEGRVGEEIPLEARIMAIADVYDALVSKRCYKQPMSFEKAAQIMLEGMGSQFDPNMYTVFLDCQSKLENYYREN